MGVKGRSAVESQVRMLNLAKEIVERASKELPNLVEVYVFGSRARGDYLDTSDIDLVFVLTGIKEMPVVERMYLVGKYIKGNVDYVVLDESERDRIREKKLLWRRGSGFADFREFLD